MTRLKVLMVASEFYPLLKTGGLADAVAGLAKALSGLGHDVRLIMPAYSQVLNSHPYRQVATFIPPQKATYLTLLSVSSVSGISAVWLLSSPKLSRREGHPYYDYDLRPHPDNPIHFNDLARVAAAIAGNRAGLRWTPDIVHLHDWQTGLTAPWMLNWRISTPAVFTIHNIGYQGLFPAGMLQRLGLPAWLWHYQALEFYNQLNFLKGGLVFSDQVTTVSPTYAKEILTPQYGNGLDAVLQSRRKDFRGILNGIDPHLWNPATDADLDEPFSELNLASKYTTKQSLVREFGLKNGALPLVLWVGRFAWQKGTDLILDSIRELLSLPLNMIVLGNGDPTMERRWRMARNAYKGQLGLKIGQDEKLAHRLVGASDMLLMPSRYEPCGLTQLYAMRYGTIPIARETGGLKDTVLDAGDLAAPQPHGTGFLFRDLTTESLLAALRRAMQWYSQRDRWEHLQREAMAKDHTWEASAKGYLQLYAQSILTRRSPPK